MDNWPLKYWSWDDLKVFTTTHDLVIATGLDNSEECALTPKGFELMCMLQSMMTVERRNRDDRVG